MPIELCYYSFTSVIKIKHKEKLKLEIGLNWAQWATGSKGIGKEEKRRNPRRQGDARRLLLQIHGEDKIIIIFLLLLGKREKIYYYY